ncbi:YaiI/YqxD family protein [Lysobacter fragariae]
MSDAGAAQPAGPQIWVDADACPGVIKDILFRAAERAQIAVTLVANQWLRTPPSRYIRALQVTGGFDVADDEIVERVQHGDLVVTQDIPLAARVLEKGAIAINPRGERYTPDNMAERLSMRNFMEELRGAGVQTGGPAVFHARDRQAFANQLDRWIAQRRIRGAVPYQRS